MREMHEKFPEYRLLPMPLFPHQIRGVESLREFADKLFATCEPRRPQPSFALASEVK